jgi:hypothetical protein
MESKYFIAIIILLFVVIGILSYVAYVNDKKIKKIQAKLNDASASVKKEEPRPMIPVNRSLLSAYSTPEIKNYYRTATVPERKWQKVGVLTSDDKTMNLLARPSTYNEDVWQYRAEDRDGFIIDLGEMQALRSGQVIPPIAGKASAGSWTVSIYPRDTHYY